MGLLACQGALQAACSQDLAGDLQDVEKYEASVQAIVDARPVARLAVPEHAQQGHVQGDHRYDEAREEPVMDDVKAASLRTHLAQLCMAVM